MRSIVAALTILGFCGQAMADQCYVRTYSDEHLRKNPNQVVRDIRMILPDVPTEFASAIVKFRDSPRSFQQGFNCYVADDPKYPDAFLYCSVDCDGGTFVARQPGDDRRSILVTTPWGFIVSGGCGEEEEETRNVLDKDADGTTFKLYQAELSECR